MLIEQYESLELEKWEWCGGKQMESKRDLRIMLAIKHFERQANKFRNVFLTCIKPLGTQS